MRVESLILTGVFDVREFLMRLLLGTDRWTPAVFQALYIAGVWKMLEKSGIRGWWALIPCAREYQLARCAGREPEGRVLSVLTFFNTFLSVIGVGFLVLFGFNSAVAAVMLDVFLLALGISVVIFNIRVCSGLIEVYGVRRRWMWAWIIPYADCLTALLWGFSKRFRPSWKVEDIRAELAKLATKGSAAVLGDGLTVNLKERSVTDFFQKKILLRDIHLAIPQGRLVLLLGGSGAGKTTFVNAINGFEKADAEVLLNGQNIYKNYRKMMYDMGFVPQQEMMRGKDTVLNTLLDAAKLRLPWDVPAAQRRERVDAVMEIFGLKAVRTSLVEKLSGGQKKRLSISMEFLCNPSLFILDEPDSGLDGVMARELFVQLRKIADSGKIVIVITHTPDRVIDLFDDVIVLAKDSARTGRLAFYGSIEEARKFFERDRMEQIVKSVNRKEEGGDGLADQFVMKFAEVQNG